MANYEKMFGLSYSALVKRGMGGERFHPQEVAFEIGSEGPMLEIYVGDSNAEDVDHHWPEFRQGLHTGTIVKFVVECPRCMGEGNGQSDACPACGMPGTCTKCDGEGLTPLFRAVE